ncbi:hypothetical protein [Sporomusa termitida]|uniref:Uncharacterized protein n=1 Tax=Sporomusa termitida TaxID=2377 RepID=A0A517DQK8_9FIRM|nr:hypothetical protein [Sporomusa termitida]QDR79644.1 hypothetical protein SPTER_09330 [Sporomusa termitida]
MDKCGHNGEQNESKLLCVTCNTTQFEVIEKIGADEVVARCGSCGQETDLGVIVGARYGGAVEVIAALRTLYAVSHYKARKNKDELGVVRYCKKHDQLQAIIAGTMYHNPLDMAADLYKLIENTPIDIVEAKQIIANMIKKRNHD